MNQTSHESNQGSDPNPFESHRGQEPHDYEGTPRPPEAFPPRRAPIKLPEKTPWATYVILVITILIYLAQMGTNAIVGQDLPAALGMKVNPLIVRGQWWRLITPIFLHANLLHIGFNMYALHILGPGLESHFGHSRFLALYFLSGFAGNVASMVFTAANSLGASTAVFGLLGAQGVFVYQNREIFGDRAQLALRNIIMLAAINLAIGLSPGIDNWGHMGGLVGGALFTWFAGPVLRLQGIHPFYELKDERNSAATTLAVLGVGGIFLFIAVAAIIFGMV